MQTITLTAETESIKYLCSKDKRLAKVISIIGNITYNIHNDSYAFLVHEIIEQMLSIKAGAKIYARLEDMCNNKICPTIINELTDDEIRSIGTANSKVKAIRDLTDAVLNNKISFENLASLPDDEVIKQLTQIRGIGPWTAKMYLLFVLNRQDILPIEDVAFLQAYKWLYKTSDLSKLSITKKCQKWSPYSSIAARYMYRALDSGLTKQDFHLYK